MCNFCSNTIDRSQTINATQRLSSRGHMANIPLRPRTSLILSVGLLGPHLSPISETVIFPQVQYSASRKPIHPLMFQFRRNGRVWRQLFQEKVSITLNLSPVAFYPLPLLSFLLLKMPTLSAIMSQTSSQSHPTYNLLTHSLLKNKAFLSSLLLQIRKLNHRQEEQLSYGCPAK